MKPSQEQIDFDKAYSNQYGGQAQQPAAPKETQSDLIGKELSDKVNSQNTDPEQAEIAALPADQQQFVKDNSGIAGSLRVGAESAGNELAFGLPELAYKHFADPNDVAQHEALKHFHQTANIVGGGLGAVGSLALGGPIFKGAAEAGRLAEGAVLGGRAAEETSLARALASKLVGGAAEGAVIGAPRSAGDLAFGDPKEAAENLLVSAGIGGLLGPASFALKKGAEVGADVAGNIGGAAEDKLGSFIKDPDPQLSLFQDVNKSNLLSAQLSDAGRSAIDKTLVGALKKTLTAGGIAHGPLGYVASQGIGEIADKAVQMIPDSAKTAGLQATLKAVQFGNKQLSKIPDILDYLSTSQTGQAMKEGPSIFAQMGKDVAKQDDEYKQFETISKKLAQSSVSDSGQDNIANNALALKHNPEVQTAYAGTALNTVQYLNSILPKNPNQPLPFSKNTWKPSQQQLNDFKGQLDLIHNPYKILDKLKNGQVSPQDVKTLQTVYPTIYGKIVSGIMSHAADPKYADMPYNVKSNLAQLTGMSLDPTFDPQTMSFLQSNFQPGKDDQSTDTPTKDGSLKALKPPEQDGLSKVVNGNVG